MRKLLELLLVCICASSNAQDSILPSDRGLSVESIADSNKVIAILNTAGQHIYNDASRSVHYYLGALEMSERIGYLPGKVTALIWLGEAFVFSGNHTKAVETSVRAIAEAEKLGNRRLISLANLKMASIYVEIGDYHEAIKYARKSCEYVNNPGLYQLGVLAGAFSKINSLDSALFYAQRAYEIDLRDTSHWGMPYHTLGDIYTKLTHYSLAQEYYRMGLAVKPNAVDSIACLLGIGTIYKKVKLNDSVLVYAYKAIQSATAHSLPNVLSQAYGLIKDVYKGENQIDSAFVYQELMLAAKDSVFADNKLQQIQNIKFNEQLRQIDIQETEAAEKESRRRNLQYAAIAIGVISFVVLFFSISNSILVKENFVRFFGVVALLLVFEFINLFSHPFISEITHHSPFWMFLIMVCIAALLVPAHHKLQAWITHQLVAKNKRIRLAAAKKTIAQLEK